MGYWTTFEDLNHCGTNMLQFRVYLCLFLIQVSTYITVWAAVNTLWPSDVIWRHRSGSTWVQIMACCLTAPSHNLNQCWLLINEAMSHSFASSFTVSAPATILYNEFDNFTFKITAIYPRTQYVKKYYQWREVIQHHISLSIFITVRCRYNAVVFLQNPRKRHPIAHLLRDVFYGLQLLIYILP